MGKWKKVSRGTFSGRQRESAMAKVSVILLLLNVFIWAGLRNLDILMVTLASAIVAAAGLVLAVVSGRYVKRRQGRVGGEALSQIGYWGNLGFFVLSFFLFSYAFAMAVLRGDIL
jgi:hypothetical protein